MSDSYGPTQILEYTPSPSKARFNLNVSSELLLSEPKESTGGPSAPFAKIIPANKAARDAFHDLILGGSLKEYHQDFLVTDDQGEPIDEPHGHFKLSFEKCPPYLSTIGYRIGKGTSKFPKDRSVDIMIVSPETDYAQDIASNHALIQVHPESGVIILAAGTLEKPLFYSLENVEIELLHPQKHVMYQASNRFRIGELAYDMRYTVTPESSKEYIKQRNQVLTSIYGSQAPHPSISAIPKPHDRKLGIAIIHGSINSGSFGLVSAGIHRKTGEPLAVKELWIKDRNSFYSVSQEVEVAWAFIRAQRGILQTVDVQCEHGGKMPSGKTPEKVYIFTRLARSSFWEHPWAELLLNQKLALFKDTLQGLCSLHNAKYMHRDITVKNLLVVSLTPPSAVICDFGKVTNEISPTETGLGPLSTLAPEVNGNVYTNKIDVWSLGWAWFRVVLDRSRYDDKKIDFQTYKAVRSKILNAKIEHSGAFAALMDLLEMMLAWEPEKRISAQKATQHPCWQYIPKDLEPPEKGSDHPTKKARLESR